jgi:hypothetical protein
MNLLTALLNHIEKYKPKSCKELIDFFPIDIKIKLKNQDVEWLSVSDLKQELESQKLNEGTADNITLYTFIFNSFLFASTKEEHNYWLNKSFNYCSTSGSYVFKEKTAFELKYLL